MCGSDELQFRSSRFRAPSTIEGLITVCIEFLFEDIRHIFTFHGQARPPVRGAVPDPTWPLAVLMGAQVRCTRHVLAAACAARVRDPWRDHMSSIMRSLPRSTCVRATCRAASLVARTPTAVVAVDADVLPSLVASAS